MKLRTGRVPSTRQGDESDAEDSSFIPGSSISSVSGLSGTFHADDRITETSLTRARVRDNTREDGDEGSVRDTSLSSKLDDAASSEREIDDRPRSILALLLRPQSRQFLERVLSTDNPQAQAERLGPALLKSHDVLYAFARLVVLGGLAVSDGRLALTPLTERILRVVGDTSKA